jgi:outer membrane protein OmpA-like peptidoglycan-associated protein
VRVVAWVVVAACAHSAPAVEPHEETPTSASQPARQPRRVVTDTKIEILDPIRFVGQTAQIELASLRMLDEVAATMERDPSIRLMEVHAYGADGAPEFQQVMGAARANAVVAELIKRKVDPKRLLAVGEAAPASGPPTQVVFIIAERK